MRKLMDHRLLQFEKGIFDKPGNYDSIRDHEFTPLELAQIKNNSGRVVSGTPGQVKAQLMDLADQFEVDEIMAVTMTGKPRRQEAFVRIACDGV
jgi:alkanesulfonate monooxygenase SsuD/methylene tetrahydromethanopterin reductase-like flavin-dependent oxidoreductase (luciferase family)